MTAYFEITPTTGKDPRVLGLELTTSVGEWQMQDGKLIIAVNDMGDQETIICLANCHADVASWRIVGPAIGERVICRGELPECWRR